MTQYIYFSHTCPETIWGLTSAERIERLLLKNNILCLTTPLNALQEQDSVLILRGDFLFDDRLVNYLISTPKVLLRLDEDQQGTYVAAHVPSHMSSEALAIIESNAVSDTHQELSIETPTTTAVSFLNKLRKFEPPFVLPITADNTKMLEKRLFDWSYKGITDLVTKWVWPNPARWAVGHCVRLGIRPNHVTLVSLALVILAGILFSYGHYGLGLLAGWLMTFLDTVDGKLARVTVTSSNFGHYFDHLIDLIHPPIWYILWGLGLSATQLTNLNFSLSSLFYAIIIGYIAGRLVEGSFKWVLHGNFGIFSWRPLDAYFRLITARRNPNMIFLTISALAGRPELGLLAVTGWTVATSIFLLVRFAHAGYIRSQQGELSSWLADADTPRYNKTLAARLFTKHLKS